MKRSSPYRSSCILVSILLFIVCTACTSGGTTTVPVKTPLATRIIPHATPTSSTGNHTPPNFTLFTKGDGYKITYPTAWDLTTNDVRLNPSTGTADMVDFNDIDNSHDYEFYVAIIPNPTTQTSLYTTANNYIKDEAHFPRVHDYHNLNLALTRKVNGIIWNQVAVETYIGVFSVKVTFVCLVIKYPTKKDPNRLLLLSYSTDTDHFKEISTLFFEPMIQSFAFTSH